MEQKKVEVLVELFIAFFAWTFITAFTVFILVAIVNFGNILNAFLNSDKIQQDTVCIKQS